MAVSGQGDVGSSPLLPVVGGFFILKKGINLDNNYNHTAQVWHKIFSLKVQVIGIHMGRKLWYFFTLAQIPSVVHEHSPTYPLRKENEQITLIIIFYHAQLNLTLIRCTTNAILHPIHNSLSTNYRQRHLVLPKLLIDSPIREGQ